MTATGDHPDRPRPDRRQRALGAMLRGFNPVVRRMVAAGIPTGAPNVLLTAQGRRSGTPRTVPLGMVRLDGRRFVQASYGETGWVRNVRANREATLTDGDRREQVDVVELAPEEGGAVLRSVLAPFHRSRVLGALMGPRFRPPIGVLWRIHLRIDDTPAEYTAEARRHPVFELRPPAAGAR